MPQLFRRLSATLLFLLLAATGQPGLAADDEECLRRFLEEGDDTLTLGEIKAACRPPASAAEKKPATETPSAGAEPPDVVTEPPVTETPKTHASRFSVTPHKQNYILFFSHNTAPNSDPYPDTPDDALDHNEVTFQVSLKFPIGSLALEDKKIHFMAAYTAHSFWQAYNKKLSSPFRETNHEPEVFALYDLDLKIPGVRRTSLMGGIVHQSNGRSEPQSRSWNRLYLDIVFEGENFKISLKPWYIIPEETSGYLVGSDNNDNPDISDYLGYGEISGAWRLGDHTLSFLVRNNLDFHGNKGAVKLGWSFKMPFIKTENLKGYIHYFNGYGESLIDYNAAVQRFGVGLMLADWF